jgi:hypothetical protein
VNQNGTQIYYCSKLFLSRADLHQEAPLVIYYILRLCVLQQSIYLYKQASGIFHFIDTGSLPTCAVYPHLRHHEAHFAELQYIPPVFVRELQVLHCGGRDVALWGSMVYNRIMIYRWYLMMDMRVMIYRWYLMMDKRVIIYRSSPRHISFMGGLLQGVSGSVAQSVTPARR